MCLGPLGRPAPPGHLHAVPDGLYRVEGGAYIQNGELVGVFVDFTVIVVDDIAHLLPTAVNDPVMAVKRQLIAKKEKERQQKNSFQCLPQKKITKEDTIFCDQSSDPFPQHIHSCCSIEGDLMGEDNIIGLPGLYVLLIILAQKDKTHTYNINVLHFWTKSQADKA